MLRIKDPEASLKFYREVRTLPLMSAADGLIKYDDSQILGMDLLSGEQRSHVIHHRQTLFYCLTEQRFADFSLYFLGYDHSSELTAEERAGSRFDREGTRTLQCTQNDRSSHRDQACSSSRTTTGLRANTRAGTRSPGALGISPSPSMTSRRRANVLNSSACLSVNASLRAR